MAVDSFKDGVTGSLRYYVQCVPGRDGLESYYYVGRWS